MSRRLTTTLPRLAYTRTLRTPLAAVPSLLWKFEASGRRKRLDSRDRRFTGGGDDYKIAAGITSVKFCPSSNGPDSIFSIPRTAIAIPEEKGKFPPSFRPSASSTKLLGARGGGGGGGRHGVRNSDWVPTRPSSFLPSFLPSFFLFVFSPFGDAFDRGANVLSSDLILLGQFRCWRRRQTMQ